MGYNKSTCVIVHYANCVPKHDCVLLEFLIFLLINFNSMHYFEPNAEVQTTDFLFLPCYHHGVDVRSAPGLPTRLIFIRVWV